MGALAKSMNEIIRTENSSITSLENAYMKHGRQNTYVALDHEDINFVWCTKEVERFRSMWKANYDVWKIAKQLGRSVHDVIMLAYDQHLNGKIETRKGGVLGDAI